MAKRVQYFDLTLNVDWDYDNAMDRKRIQLGTGTNRGGTGDGARPAVVLDRTYVTNLVNQRAHTVRSPTAHREAETAKAHRG